VRRWIVRTLAVVGGAVVVGFLILALAALLTGGERVPSRAVLELDLERGLVEYVPDDPLAQAIHGRRTTVLDVVEALERASGDDRVRALVVRVGSGDLGWAQVEEVREAVGRFRASGKPAIVFSETFGEFGPGHGGYYLATAFDQVVLQPSGDVGLSGLRSESPFLSGTLEELRVQPQMDHRHEYKNALNLFTESEFTEAHREATLRIVESIHEQLVAGVAEGRRLPAERARELIGGGPWGAEDAVRAGLVDRLAYRDQLYDSLRAEYGRGTEFMYLRRYLAAAGRAHTRGETVAVIYGVGGVQRGESEVNPVFGGLAMGAETVTRAFHRAIQDPAVRAIVFRIDSPGGSYVASDAVWREVVRARAAGKPVIASMGNVAASGGYFVAMPADRIVAHPSTLTGSIGVVGGKMVTRGLMNRLGVTFDAVSVGENATMWSGISEYSPEEWQRVQEWLDRVYVDFTTKAAEGRGRSREEIHELARGRVWTGADAQRVGLVDELGGYHVALRLAREAMGVEADAPLRLRIFPERRTLLESILDRGPRSSRPEASQLLLERAVHLLEPAARTLHRAGLLGAPGALTAPPVDVR
jgi:protease IV